MAYVTLTNLHTIFLSRAFSFDQNGTKCHLLSYDNFTRGVRIENDFNFDLYQKKDFVKECIIGTGLNYKGKISKTETGEECQKWDLNTPHEHHFLPRRHKKKDLRDNLCRNPDNSTTGPWCFTKNPNIRYQNCNIPQCSEVECMTCNGESYRGPMDHTESGRECQRWDLDEPHKHLFHPKRYPDNGLKDNYCRNPDGRQRPWCFTTDPDVPWEYCSIKQCDSDNQSNIETTTTCFCDNGAGYRGTVAVPREGLTCQRWDAQFPHSHSYMPQKYRCKDLSENFCRNPDGRDAPWCFTTDPNIPWAFCKNIPRCGAAATEPEECYKGSEETYRGKQMKTRSGILCAPWRDHSERNKREVVTLSEELEGNFCRNPDKDKHGPWCYTNSSLVPWDYCTVKLCKATHWCGGSLVREEWVLTDRDPSCPVAALITEHVRIIQLPVAGCRIQEGIVCSTYGWGETKDTGHEGTLKSVHLPIVSNERCEQLHRGSLQITNAKVCAGGKRDEGVCEKDYGGPLVCQEKGSKVIVGVSIHGRGCARHNRPGIFVNVAHYTGWIHKVFKTYPYSDFNY
uniref:Hepatocyte growth factor n=1 Tax=Astyanax mexicanus TaxID=7994 RepID=A0A8B9HMH8_ASTMX